MISVIIPTLLKVERLGQTIQELIDCEEVGEIIIINNTLKYINFNHPKIKQIFEGKNTYVNPAWNKGASIASFDKLCFLNDDIWFDWKYLKEISNYITEENGMIGMHSFNIGMNFYSRETIPTFRIYPIESNEKTTRGNRPTGYGCCFFIHKKNWDPIPEDLKIWCGDDWIFYRSTHQNYIIDGLKCEGKMSSTTDDESLSKKIEPIKENDMKIMLGLIKQGLVENYFLGTKWWN